MEPKRDTKNIIIAILLSVVIIAGWQYFIEMPRQEKERAALQTQQQQQVATAAQATNQATNQASTQVAPGEAAEANLARADALALSQRIVIDTPKLKGSVALKGGRIDDLVLKAYRETVEPDSANIVLLSPAKAKQAYFADTGWVESNACQKTALVDVAYDSDDRGDVRQFVADDRQLVGLLEIPQD